MASNVPTAEAMAAATAGMDLRKLDLAEREYIAQRRLTPEELAAKGVTLEEFAKAVAAEEAEKAARICCSTNMCRGLMISTLVAMIVIFILAVVLLGLDFSETISIADDRWIVLAILIVDLIGLILAVVMYVRCDSCKYCD